MTKANVTVQLDTEVIKRAKVAAARRGTSISALVARQIADLADEDDRYEAAHRRAMELMDRATAHGGRNWTREDLHAERVARYAR